jgi:two-component system chemotaxis response regulator CheY
MIGGNLKPLLGTGALLSPPKLIYCQNFDPALVGGVGIESLSFTSPHWGMSLVLSPSDFALKDLWDAHGFIKSTSKGDAMRILVIEDEPVSQKVLGNILSSYGSVDMAGDGLEGLKKFEASLEQKKPYDLICLDIMMPHVPGLEVLQKIRQEEAKRGMQGLAGTKVIMTSALDDGKNVLGSFRAGCEAYIVKPVDRTQLLDTVLKLFGDRISKKD